MWNRLRTWFESINPFEETVDDEETSSTRRDPHRLNPYRSADDDDDGHDDANAEETCAVATAELRRIEARITQSEEALYGCQSKLSSVSSQAQALFEALEGILLESHDHEAFSSLPVPEKEEEAQAARHTAQRREREYERARQSAVTDVTGMVAAIFEQRDRLETRLVHLQVNLKTLEVQRDRVRQELAAQAQREVLATGDLIPYREPGPEMMFEMEIREADPNTASGQ